MGWKKKKKNVCRWNRIQKSKQPIMQVVNEKVSWQQQLSSNEILTLFKKSFERFNKTDFVSFLKHCFNADCQKYLGD